MKNVFIVHNHLIIITKILAMDSLSNTQNHLSVIKKFYPTVEECKVNNVVKCTENGCQTVFTSQSNLTLHLAKTHKKSCLLQSDSSIKQYYCPELGCVYNKNKFFRNLKFLRQHYSKVHSSKDFQCHICKKSFPTDNILRNHMEYCGVNFYCCECSASYPCYNTLKTHGRRKKHKILVKIDYKSKYLESRSEHISFSSKNRLILPKENFRLIVLSSTHRPTTDQEIQTEGNKQNIDINTNQINKDIAVSQNTQQTQTGSKHVQLTVETQTLDNFNLNRKNIDESFTDVVSLTSSITQTDLIESKTTSCNTSFNLDDFDFTKSEVEKNSLGTQTSYSNSTITHDSLNTDTSRLLGNSFSDNIENFEFYNCNIETQTDFMLDDEMFDSDYYMSNMYTQTCDDILSDLGFSDIQTQTAIDDILRSVESQTVMSHGNKVFKDTSHTETQTDIEFRQMLEDINS